MLGVLHPARRKNEGNNLGRKHLELSKRRRALALKKLRGKRAKRKAACKKHKAARRRSRLDELSSRSTRSTFAQQPSTALTVIDSIDTLPRPCAAKGCDVIGLQETKRGGTSELMASGYGVFFHGDCSGVKGRKGQHGAGLVIKEDFVKKAGEDDIAIECIISARILKARIAIESNYVAFVVAYAPTEEVPEGQKAKYKAALNNTVASVPAREYVYVLTDAHARTGMRCKGGREAGSKVLGEFDRDVLNENRKLLLGFAEGNKLAFSEHFLLHPQKWRVLHVPKRQPQQETNTFGLYPDKRSGPSTDPLRSIPPAPFRSTRIGSQSRIREHPHSTQVRTKREERDSTKELRRRPTSGG